MNESLGGGWRGIGCELQAAGYRNSRYPISHIPSTARSVGAALALCATLALSLLRSVSAGLAELRRVGAIDFGWLFRATKSAGLALLFLSITGAAQAAVLVDHNFSSFNTGDLVGQQGWTQIGSAASPNLNKQRDYLTTPKRAK